MYMHLVAPYILRYFKPRRTGRRVIRVCWRYLSKTLRLSAYMFGGKFPEEEMSYPYWVSREDGKFEGSYRRVPNRDGIALVRNRPTLVEIDDQGVPTTEQGLEVLALQNAECIKAKREVLKDYVTIYVPPNFRLRIIAFVCGISLLGILALTICIGIPVPLGRHVFSFFTSEEVHDGYSFIVGCSLIWSCFSIGKAVNDCINRRLIDINAPTTDAEEKSDIERRLAPRASWALFMLKQGIRWVGQAAWLGFWLGFVIPILLSVVFDFYLVFPIRSLSDPGFQMKIDIPMAWLSGLLYAMIGLKSAKRQPGPRRSLMMELDRVMY